MDKRAVRNNHRKGQKRSPYVPVAPMLLRFVKLADEIMQSFENPANWPLSDSEKNSFMRQTFFQTRKIVDTDEYRLLKVQIAAENLDEFFRNEVRKIKACHVPRV